MGSPKMDEMENRAADNVRTSSPLSSLHDADLAQDSPAKLPAVEDMELSSPAGDKESPAANVSPPKKESPQTKESPSSKDSPSATKTSPAKSSKKRKKFVVKRPSRKPRWDSESLLSDPKSPLASAELRVGLSIPQQMWHADMPADIADQPHGVGCARRRRKSRDTGPVPR